MYGLGVKLLLGHTSFDRQLFQLSHPDVLTDDDSKTPQNFPVSLNNIALEVVVRSYIKLQNSSRILRRCVRPFTRISIE